MSIATRDVVPEYDAALRETFVALIAEFFALPQSEVRARLGGEFPEPGAQVAQSWRLADPRTPEEITRFYQETHSYIYDLAGDHCRLRRRPVWKAIVQRIERRGAGQRVLLYGDGIGSDSIALARRGHGVTYFDLAGVTANFARFRFAKEGLQHRITVVERAGEIPAEAFDVVVCIEVLEHVVDPPATMRDIYRALKEGGIALITESFESIGPEFPSHLPANFRYAGRIHQLMEGIGFANTYYNLNPINRPIEFTKVRRGIPGRMLQAQGKLRRAIDTRWRRLRPPNARPPLEDSPPDTA
jgi:ubiquinone/menaquinone biosynthesis C-methylase UbiE